jgi:hypothetical protein
MATRIELQSLLESLLGSRNVYYQPDVNIKLKYPCIVYDHDHSDTQFADNAPYSVNHRYLITVIDVNPENPVLDKLIHLPQCLYDRHFSSDGLNHNTFNLYY